MSIAQVETGPGAAGGISWFVVDDAQVTLEC